MAIFLFTLCCVILAMPLSWTFCFPVGERLSGLWNGLGIGLIVCTMLYIYLVFIHYDWKKISDEIVENNR
jgi:Na+-driven multidrug efflux pump